MSETRQELPAVLSTRLTKSTGKRRKDVSRLLVPGLVAALSVPLSLGRATVSHAVVEKPGGLSASTLPKREDRHLGYRLTTYTGVAHFLFLYDTVSGARIAGLPSSHVRLRFVRLLQGQYRNWSWRVTADRRVVSSYRPMKGKLGIGWGLIFRTLRRDVKAYISQPPSMSFLIQMIPVVNYREQCNHVRFDEFSVCYAFPFPRAVNPRVWAGAMVSGFDSLAHEIAIATLDPSSHTMTDREVLEAQASLFNQYATFRFANAVERHRLHLQIVLLPAIYRISPSKELKLTKSDMALYVGAQIAGHALRKALGGERVICPRDRQIDDRYKELLHRVMQHPAILRRYAERERQRLHARFPGGVVQVITSQGTRRAVALRLLDTTKDVNRWITVSGMYASFEDASVTSKWHGPMRPKTGGSTLLALCSSKNRSANPAVSHF